MKIPKHIKDKMNRNLFEKKNHPICIIKEKIYEYFGDSFYKIEDYPKIVTTEMNFDNLLIKPDHPSRSKSDTYYAEEDMVLRTHMTAFLTWILEISQSSTSPEVRKFKNFLYVGDVYRKDEIDSTHYPIFHQLDGVCILDKGEDPISALKKSIGGLIEHLFPNCEYEFKDEYYPFNSTAFEVNVKFNEKWIEVLGCGVKRQEILDKSGLTEKIAWGFGLGLDRLAMIFFEIPDIRYIWSEDERFLKQFKNGEITKFKSYSKYPPVFKDISFFKEESFNINDFYEIIREDSNDLIENIILTDDFYSEKEQKKSLCFRLTYRSNDRTLTDDEINKVHNNIKEKVKSNSQLKLR